jgi:peroxisomal membrane protein 4
MDKVQDLVVSPALQEYLAILKGARNGLIYGIKVRFPHALTMAILFGRGDWRMRAAAVFRATKQHALNLAKFVSIYKTMLLIQRKANGGKERNADTFIAGLVGGYLVFGKRSAVNEQIVLYVVSRVLASFIPRAAAPYSSSAPASPGTVKPLPPDARHFAFFAALSWGAVMWLFRNRGQTIQPGMFNAMTYLYLDSERWRDLRTLLWHNI